MRGRIAITIPRVSVSKIKEDELVSKYQTLTVTAVKCLRDFLNNPTKENYEKIDAALLGVLHETAAIKKYAGKKFAGQIEMEL